MMRSKIDEALNRIPPLIAYGLERREALFGTGVVGRLISLILKGPGFALNEAEADRAAFALLREEVERLTISNEAHIEAYEEVKARAEKSEAELADLKKKYEGAKQLLFGEQNELARWKPLIEAAGRCPIEDLESCIEVNGQDLNPDPALDIIRAALKCRAEDDASKPRQLHTNAEELQHADERAKITTGQMINLIEMEMHCAADGRDHEAMRSEEGFLPPDPGWYQQRWEILEAIRSRLAAPLEKSLSRELVASILAEAGGDMGIETERVERACVRLREAGVVIHERTAY